MNKYMINRNTLHLLIIETTQNELKFSFLFLIHVCKKEKKSDKLPINFIAYTKYNTLELIKN